jgi:hypothetical protein
MHNPFAETIDESTDSELIEQSKNGSKSAVAADNWYDNGCMESCFGTIKNELQLEDYATDAEAIRALGSYINYYNLERLHSSLGYVTPSEFKTQPFTNLPTKNNTLARPRDSGPSQCRCLI